jgi:predicted lipoprotein with Yx(FWY)xxD motif
VSPDSKGHAVKNRVQIATVIAVSAALVGLGSAPPALAAHHRGILIKSHQMSLGKVLTNAKGRYLYLFSKDTKGKSHCHATCLTEWPRVTSTHKPRAGTGVKGKHLGRITHNQVTYFGHPLYYFVGDPRKTHKGEGVNGFFLVSAATGKAVKPKPSGGGGGTTGGPTTAAEVGSATLISPSGEAIVNHADSLPLYYLSSETTTAFYCTATCLQTWTPLLTHGAPTTTGDANSDLLGTTTRADDHSYVQVTYNGHPVYTFSSDYPGYAYGDGSAGAGPSGSPGTWHALTPAGGDL